MTRRIVLAILLTVWATLLACGLTAYLTTRAVLLADLDEGLIARASTLPQLVDSTGRRTAPNAVGVRPDDRFILRNELGQTVVRPPVAPTTAPAFKPEVLRVGFARLADGTRVRTVTFRAPPQGSAGTAGTSDSATLTFSGSAEQFDRLLNRLAWALTLAGLMGALLSALLARAVAERCLQPLRNTAEVVGSIDDMHLDRRIDQSGLPVELVPVASRLNEMLARLDDAIRRRRRFTADASHELRTPVAALVTALEVALRRERDSEYYRRTLQTCLLDAHLLQRLVEALLTQVKSELSATQQPAERIDVAAVVSECVLAVKPLAENRSIAVSVSVQPPMLRLMTQPDRFRSILINLIGNAVEHNRSGGNVQIDCSPTEDPQTLRIEVRDDGPGIAPEHLPHVFEPFYRADPSRGVAAGAPSHLGLGLFLVQTHAQALGGSCQVQNVAVSGATFRVTLPGVVPPDASEQTLQAAPTAMREEASARRM